MIAKLVMRWQTLAQGHFRWRIGLDRIAEFAKINLCLNFCVRATFRQGLSSVRLLQMQSAFLVCLSAGIQKVAMSCHKHNSLLMCFNFLTLFAQTYALWQHVFFMPTLRQTQNTSDAICNRRTLESPCRNLSGHKL